MRISWAPKRVFVVQTLLPCRTSKPVAVAVIVAFTSIVVQRNATAVNSWSCENRRVVLQRRLSDCGGWRDHRDMPSRLGSVAAVGALLAFGCGGTPEPGRYCEFEHEKNCWEVDLGARKAWLVFPSGKRAPGSMALRPTTAEGASFAAPAVDGEVLFKPNGPGSIIIKHSGTEQREKVYLLKGPLTAP